MPNKSVELSQEQLQKIIDANRLWVEKAVIGLNLCPFAKGVYVKDQVRFVVSHAATLKELQKEVVDELLFLQGISPEITDTTLIIIPQLLRNFLRFNEFVHSCDELLDDMQLLGEIQIASFHPQFQFAQTDPDDISNYTNRSPHPILHLIREESLDRAIEQFPEAEAIFDRNIELMNKLGHDGWEDLFKQTD